MPTTTEARRLQRLSEETKNVATKLTDPEARRAMREVAWGYRILAEHARQREAEGSSSSFTQPIADHRLARVRGGKTKT